MSSTLITGANRGLGFEFARQYLADGWQVYAARRDPRSASELRCLADKSRGRLQVLRLDVTDVASVRAAAVELQGESIDLLLNNAGREHGHAESGDRPCTSWHQLCGD
jgi:NAD(P)-dependent dehydrogenase (short-subunit alcohol dehydrogenase family)